MPRPRDAGDCGDRRPAGYGRIVRDGAGRFTALSSTRTRREQRAIREVNPSYYCFDRGDSLRPAESRPQPVSGEYYLTDTLELLLMEGSASRSPRVPAEDVLSINTPEDLAMVDRLFRPAEESRTQSGSPA
jgi:bifunctional N-acetylglucosamine-1-phosphate-uridyltransferase/glucosamine-1-phosphate-acetyltransferase GlmU-like protein